jgi:hypothetical protein
LKRSGSAPKCWQRAAGACQGAHCRLGKGLPGLIDEKPAEALLREQSQHAIDGHERGRDERHHEEERRPEVRQHRALLGGEATPEPLHQSPQVVPERPRGRVDERLVQLHGRREELAA